METKQTERKDDFPADDFPAFEDSSWWDELQEEIDEDEIECVLEIPALKKHKDFDVVELV